MRGRGEGGDGAITHAIFRAGEGTKEDARPEVGGWGIPSVSTIHVRVRTVLGGYGEAPSTKTMRQRHGATKSCRAKHAPQLYHTCFRDDEILHSTGLVKAGCIEKR